MTVKTNSSEKTWLELEPSLSEVIEKYPGVSPFVILKIDLQRRGVIMTNRAMAAIDPKRDSLFYRGINLENNGGVPNGIPLRDGSSVLCTIEMDDASAVKRYREPYLVDYIGGNFVVTDEGKRVDEITFWPNPNFTDKKTSKGTPMWHVLVARPQRMDINVYQTCDFWKLGLNCKFCVAGRVYGQSKDVKAEIVDLDDVEEAVVEALKQRGRHGRNRPPLRAGILLRRL